MLYALVHCALQLIECDLCFVFDLFLFLTTGKVVKEKFGVNNGGHLDVPACLTIDGVCSSPRVPGDAFTSN